MNQARSYSVVQDPNRGWVVRRWYRHNDPSGIDMSDSRDTPEEAWRDLVGFVNNRLLIRFMRQL